MVRLVLLGDGEADGTMERAAGAVTDGRRGGGISSPPAAELDGRGGIGGVHSGRETVGRVTAVGATALGVFRVAVGKLGAGVEGDWPLSVPVGEELSNMLLITDPRNDEMSDPSIDDEDAGGRSEAGPLEKLKAEKVVHGRVIGGNTGIITGRLLG